MFGAVSFAAAPFAAALAYLSEEEPPVVVEPQLKSGGAYLRSNFVQARKRLALQRVLDFLTQEEPEEETKQIIREIKAGKPVAADKKPPVVMREVSAEKLADKLIPARIAQLPPDIDLQQVIRRAIEIAQERDDEETLMLLL